jgi:glycine/D-amino acid oxidase-like deaminating enzyme
MSVNGRQLCHAAADFLAGVMGVSPDDLPIVGPVKRFDGLWVNSGHGFRGTNHSLITADCIAKLMCKEDSSVASSLTPSRFGL